MMPLQLSAPAQSQVLLLPESGMGFQHLAAHYQGRLVEFLVLNGELALELTALGLVEGTDPVTIDSNGARVMAALNSTSSGSLVSAHTPTGFSLVTARVGSPAAVAGTTIAPASSLVKRYTLTADRRFHRYSAFSPDRRVDPMTGDFVAGTYATPESETPFVPTGFAAVGRFALPNTLAASNHYTVLAPNGTSVSFGTVAPAFGQAGGGVEAYFVNRVANKYRPPVAPSLIPDE